MKVMKMARFKTRYLHKKIPSMKHKNKSNGYVKSNDLKTKSLTTCHCHQSLTLYFISFSFHRVFVFQRIASFHSTLSPVLSKVDFLHTKSLHFSMLTSTTITFFGNLMTAPLNTSFTQYQYLTNPKIKLIKIDVHVLKT